jgi:hypothetical protein
VTKNFFLIQKICDAKYSFLLDPKFPFFLSEGDLAAGVSATAVQICGEPRLPGRVVDLYSFFPDPDPVPEFDVGDQYGSGSGPNPDPGL